VVGSRVVAACAAWALAVAIVMLWQLPAGAAPTPVARSAGAVNRVFVPLGVRAAPMGPTPAASATPAAGASPVATPAPGATATPFPSTTTDLIAAAEGAGTISTYQATLYRLQALVGDPALPGQFVSAASARRPAGHLTSDALALDDALPAAEQAALRPYLVRPNSERSYYRGAAAQRGAAAIDRPRNLQRWESAAGDRVWVWADPQSALSTTTAERVADIIGRDGGDLVLAAIEGMMGVTWAGDKRSGLNDLAQDNWFLNDLSDPNFDERLDIYVVPLQNLGETVTGSAYPSASFVLINDSISGDELEYSVRHELFHVIQYRFKMAGAHERNKWWLESTADWSVTQLQPGNSFVYADHVPHYLDRTTRRVDLWSGSTRDQLHAYGSFGWPITIDARAGGGTGAAIRDVFARMSALEPTQAIATTLVGGGKDVAEVWRDFAVASLNTDYVRRGKAGAALFGAWRPNLTQQLPTANLHARKLTTGGKSFVQNTELKVALERFGSQYWSISFEDDARQVLFRLEEWTKTTGNGVVALKRKKGEQWSSLNLDDVKEDWSKPLTGEDENWRYLCRDRKDDNLEELILVFTNADPNAAPEKSFEAEIKTDVSNVACRWRGTVSLQTSSETKLKWLFDVEGTTETTTQLSEVVLETQANPLDARPKAFMEESEYILNENPHAMPVLPTSWRIKHDSHFDLAAGGDECREVVTGDWQGRIPSSPPTDRDMFAFPFMGDESALSLVIWGENYDRFSIAVAGRLEALKTGCGESTTETVDLYPLNIGKGPAVLDDIQTVSASGDSIRVTREKTHETPRTCETIAAFDIEICTGGKVTNRWTVNLERYPE
jgi:hypothetical protein